jgi:NitT/TauT family transport system substrate-binding protein
MITFIQELNSMKTMLILRKFVPLVAFSLLIAFASSGCRNRRPEADSALESVRLQLDGNPQPEQGGFFAAQLLGYYKAEGLDVTILPLPQNGSAAQLVANGQADIALGSSDQLMESESSGLPLLAVAATMQHDPQAIMVHANSPIHSLADLEGHTIATPTGATWLKYVTSHYKLHNVRTIPSTSSIASFLADPNHVQQISVASEPFLAKQAGADVRTILINSSGYDPYRVQFTSRDFATRRPDLLTKFVRASIKGWQAYLSDPTATNAHLLQLNPALNPAQEAYAAKALRDGGFISGGDSTANQPGSMTSERWRTEYDQLKELGVFTGDVEPSSSYAIQYLP